MSESELDDLMGEVGGPCNVMGMINMFQEKMAGDGNDPDELILQAFMAYDQGSKMDVKMFQHALSTWGDKMTKAEIDDVFNEFEIDEDFMVKTKEVSASLLLSRRRRRRLRSLLRLRRSLLQRMRTLMPRRRRRRRRRLPSKCIICDQSNVACI